MGVSVTPGVVVTDWVFPPIHSNPKGDVTFCGAEKPPAVGNCATMPVVGALLTVWLVEGRPLAVESVEGDTMIGVGLSRAAAGGWQGAAPAIANMPSAADTAAAVVCF